MTSCRARIYRLIAGKYVHFCKIEYAVLQKKLVQKRGDIISIEETSSKKVSANTLMVWETFSSANLFANLFVDAMIFCPLTGHEWDRREQSVKPAARHNHER